MAEDVREVSVGVGDLWSGAAGAILVGLFTIVYTELRERRQRARAYSGYIRLLDAEIEANGRALEMLDLLPNLPWEDLASIWLDRPPSDEAWKEVRASAAPLIDEDDFKALDAYYRLLGVLLDLRKHPPDPEQGTDLLSASGVANRLLSETPRLRERLTRYTDPRSRSR